MRHHAAGACPTRGAPAHDSRWHAAPAMPWSSDRSQHGGSGVPIAGSPHDRSPCQRRRAGHPLPRRPGRRPHPRPAGGHIPPVRDWPSGTGWHAWACTSSTCATTARPRTWRMPTRRSAAPAAWVPRWPPPGPASSTASPRQSLASSSACRRCCTAAARRVRRTSRGRRCARRRAGCASPASSGRVAGRSSPRRRSRAPPPARSSTARCARACGMRRPRRRRPGRRTRARRRSPD